MRKVLLAFFTVCIFCSGFGQSRKKDQEVDIVDHQVQLGESVRMISKKYLVDPAEIYKLNKFAVEGISQGMVLKIPVPRKEGAAPKEKVTTSNEDAVVLNDNPESKPTEEKVAEPVKSETPKATPKETPKEEPVQPTTSDVKKIVITERKTEVSHKVVAKETLYSLSRDFNVSVDEIKANNPEVVKSGLKIGQVVKIPTSKSVDIQQSTAVNQTTPVTVTTEKVKTEKSKTETPSETTTAAVSGTVRHKVEPKETLYSLSRKYNVSVDEIRSQNEALLKNGLQIGQVLTIKTSN